MAKASDPVSAELEPEAQRPWFKRKRFAIPLTLVGLFLIIGILAPAPEEDVETAATSDTTTAPTEEEEAEAASTTTTTTAPPTTTTTPPAPSTTEAPSETVNQTNARRKAAEYLDYSSFSRTGLIDQLEFEGFDEADATFGVDASNVDWDEQAAKKAAEYMGYSSFSLSGLIEQLEFEGFTRAQAEYGARTTGLS